MAVKPVITNKEVIAKTRLFTIEKVQLQFANGIKYEYERNFDNNNHSILVIPLLDDKTFVMIREYVVGFDRYELGFVKGLIDNKETVLGAANRELMEEVGFKANQLTILRGLSTAPGYTNHQTSVVLAKDLSLQSLPGDEPETLEKVFWPIADIDVLLQQDDITDARTLAALYLFKQHDFNNK